LYTQVHPDASKSGGRNSSFIWSQNEIRHSLNSHLSMAADYEDPKSLMTERTIKHVPVTFPSTAHPQKLSSYDAS